MSEYRSAPRLLKFCNFCLFNPDLKNILIFFIIIIFAIFSIWIWTMSCYYYLLYFYRYFNFQITHFFTLLYITETVTLHSSEETGSENRSAWPYYYFLTLFTYFCSLGLSTVIEESIACVYSLQYCLYFINNMFKVVMTMWRLIHVNDKNAPRFWMGCIMVIISPWASNSTKMICIGVFSKQ